MALFFQPISDVVVIFAEPINVGLSLFDGLLEGPFGGGLVGMLLDEVLELLQSIVGGEATRDALDDVRESEGSHAVIFDDSIPISSAK